MSPTLLLIDDHALFRTGLRLVLAEALHHAELREAASLEQALAAPPDASVPQLILLDIQLHGVNGLDGMVLLWRRWPGCAIVVLSAEAGISTVHDALARGAVACLSKAAPTSTIVGTVQAVLRGELTAGTPQPASAGQLRLTPRQCEVLGLLCQGLSNKLIARRLDLSENTVRGHVQALLAMLGVVSRAEAAYAARNRGLVG